MSEKPYEFRELCSKDIFPMFKLINKIGFKEFKDCFQSETVKDAAVKMKAGETGNVEAVGMTIVFDVAGIIIGNLPACEDDIYSMLASVSNLNKKDIEKLPMATFCEMIVDFIKKEEFADFFKVVSRLFKSEI